ncbi:MAG: hypothetical protein IK094_01935, partial [Treponema sp.]|nr:hypothetical protein [Treponema sp.]
FYYTPPHQNLRQARRNTKARLYKKEREQSASPRRRKTRGWPPKKEFFAPARRFWKSGLQNDSTTQKLKRILRRKSK